MNARFDYRKDAPGAYKVMGGVEQWNRLAIAARTLPGTYQPLSAAVERSKEGCS